MIIRSAEFVTSAVDPAGYPDTGLPEVAFAGRSNVGKSSLINNLVNRKKLVKTSSVPGKTRTINFFRINEMMCLVDLPGYGYTRLPESVNLAWRKFMDRYFRTRAELKGVIQLIDLRHPPTAMDLRVNLWLRETGLLGGVIAVKADKLSRHRQQRSAAGIRKDLELDPECPLVVHSSQTGQGREAAWDVILGLTGQSGEA
ncbi:MAG TPA: ribosome biogenesis GTP-binding protein YihA/YsxC [bacterium]|nr:ribosome biogenesis GTP-binding protein YihA/YsxC [bacterium]